MQCYTYVNNVVLTKHFTGTKTGKALTYAREVLIKKQENRENVQDVVLLITDGNAYDEVQGPAKQLRDEGVEVR